MIKSIKKRIANLFDESEADNQYDISFTKLSIWLIGVAMVSSFTTFVFPGAYPLVRTHIVFIMLLVITAHPIPQRIIKRK